MKYRRFGRLEWRVSALGFGAMRLPILGTDATQVNEYEAVRMIRYAIDHGLNYLDSGYRYHGGNSEIVLGKALRDGYREKVRIATKMPTWQVNSQQDMDKCLDEQISRLQVNHIDFYLLHGLNGERWPRLKALDVLRWAEGKIDEGKIGHIGFSFHDDYDTFKKIIDDYDEWTLCQIQYNYIDTEYQAGTKGLRYAASKGLAVVVMEPVGGGMLAIKPSEEIQSIWDEADVKRTPADWALQYVWSQPEASVALSGMTTLNQVIENVNSASRPDSGILTAKDFDIINRVAAKYKELGLIGCTGCRYCAPCAEGVDIPQIIAFYNEYMKDRNDAVKDKYWQHITSESQAKRCAKCGKCEEICPQQLPIKSIISRAAMIFEQNN